MDETLRARQTSVTFVIFQMRNIAKGHSRIKLTSAFSYIFFFSGEGEISFVCEYYCKHFNDNVYFRIEESIKIMSLMSGNNVEKEAAKANMTLLKGETVQER